jgi:hypothetical protein
MIAMKLPAGSAMLSKFCPLLLLPLAALLGCGLTPAPSNPSSPAAFDLSGNWLAIAPFLAGTQSLPTPIAEFTGALQFSGGTVTGTLRALSPTFPNPCVPILYDLQATGTVDGADNLTLSVPISGGTATITATIGDSYNYFNSGTWQITGGACAMPSTKITMAHIAPATGTYTGTFSVLDLTTLTFEPGSATAITAVLTQSTTPNADGQFPLAGTITTTGDCNGTFTLVDEVVSGGGITLTPPLTGSPTVIFVGGVEPTATYLVTDLTPLNACGMKDYSGTLTRQ